MGQSSQTESNGNAHEQLCNKCGKCCYKKIIVGRTVFITPFPCEFLDTHSNQCTIYERRHELNPYCLSIEEGLKVSAFPADCPYVEAQAPPSYKPAKESWDWEQEWDGFDDLADDLEVSKEMREKIRARGPLAVPMYTEAYERIRASESLKASALAENAPGMIWGNSAARVLDASAVEEASGDEMPSLAALARGALLRVPL